MKKSRSKESKGLSSSWIQWPLMSLIKTRESKKKAESEELLKALELQFNKLKFCYRSIASWKESLEKLESLTLAKTWTTNKLLWETQTKSWVSCRTWSTQKWWLNWEDQEIWWTWWKKWPTTLKCKRWWRAWVEWEDSKEWPRRNSLRAKNDICNLYDFQL